jgi:hypothetical protein
MRNIDDIIAETQKTTAASLREAYEAGRASIASELKSRMANFFEGLVSGDFGAHAAPNGQHHGDSADHSDQRHESSDHHHG